MSEVKGRSVLSVVCVSSIFHKVPVITSTCTLNRSCRYDTAIEGEKMQVVFANEYILINE